ncbi:GFA family protein [Phaeobacter inhibens]|uniref:GFA family protein n=1 Tax=Phaeobacter inhibens TaxID=221822 RepID=UPI00076BB71F|nr:GFA family protein [Phaeobacter inhibens]KXF90762.1 aldehyde-activating protein [Phaeobacter inhibens]WHP69805.1 GFA family protein [Phaeobacter inhibens]
MTQPNLPLTGACLCGAVQLHVTAFPLLTLACHCRDCQKLTASAYSLTVMFPAEAVTATGELVLGGKHGEARKHYYCPTCLSFVLSRLKAAPERVNLRASLLDDLTWFTPFVEIMTEDKQPWATVPASHSYARFPTTAEELADLMDDYAQTIAPSAPGTDPA